MPKRVALSPRVRAHPRRTRNGAPRALEPLAAAAPRPCADARSGGSPRRDVDCVGVLVPDGHARVGPRDGDLRPRHAASPRRSRRRRRRRPRPPAPAPVAETPAPVAEAPAPVAEAPGPGPGACPGPALPPRPPWSTPPPRPRRPRSPPRRSRARSWARPSRPSRARRRPPRRRRGAHHGRRLGPRRGLRGRRAAVHRARHRPHRRHGREHAGRRDHPAPPHAAERLVPHDRSRVDTTATRPPAGGRLSFYAASGGGRNSTSCWAASAATASPVWGSRSWMPWNSSHSFPVGATQNSAVAVSWELL